MSKKVHIGNHGTPACRRGISAHRVGSVRPAITVSAEQFARIPKAAQCAQCAKHEAKKTDTSDFARGLAVALFGRPFV